MDFNPWLPPNNLSAHLTRLASTLTNIMRSTVNSTDPVVGVALDTQMLVNMRWTWFILPLTVFILTLAFLSATIFKSHHEKNEVGIWKTSALAILFNGPGDEAQRAMGSNCRLGEVRQKAKELSINLVP